MYRIMEKENHFRVDLKTIDQLTACVIVLTGAEFVYHKLHLSDTVMEDISSEIFKKLKEMHGGDVMVYMSSRGQFHREPDTLMDRALLVEGFCLEILEGTYHDVSYEQNCFLLGAPKKATFGLNNLLGQL